MKLISEFMRPTNLDGVIIHAREMKFDDKSDDDLRLMLIVCGNQSGQTGDKFSTAQVEHAVKMIYEELARRQRAKNQQELIDEQQKLHQAATSQGKALHSETMEELGKVKLSVDQLARARCVDKWILIAGWIAAIAALAAVALALKH
jgi:hypothetical protein